MKKLVSLIVAMIAAVETEDEHEAKKAEHMAKMTEEEITLMNELFERIDFSAYAVSDMPEGTIVTEPYFSDVLVPVMLVR